MIPEDCSLTVRDGVICITGESGDVRLNYDESGVFANDTQYLREFAVKVTDPNAPDGDWDNLYRRSGPEGIETVLISEASGEGRGDARRFLLKKDVTIDGNNVSIETTIWNHTPEENVVNIDLTALSEFRHIFECSGFFSGRRPVERDVVVSSDTNSARLSAASPDGTTRNSIVQLQGGENIKTSTDDGIAQAVISRSVSVPPAESMTIVATAELLPASGQADFDIDPSVSLETHPGLFDAAAETLQALMLPEGVPAAGAPRFVAPFGRDALIVGFQTLPFLPELTRSVLTYAARQQAKTTDPETLAEPGKILHEKRHGDLPALGQSIRSPYYGTVDATPLFAALVAAYADWVGDDALNDVLYEAAVDAAEWIVSNSDEDGLLWYEPHDHDYGLFHLGWKDSDRAIARPDGTKATPPIALAEVQGYVYLALEGVTDLALNRGDDALADRLSDRAAQLRKEFDDAFWLPEQECYALALDAKGVIDAVASNQGHVLWSGLVPDERADDVIDRLLRPDMLTEAGLRTYSAAHAAFDPLSYHRGSVWPHDTSLAAMGCARYGRDDAVNALVNRGLDTLSTTTDDPGRWGFPELLVGLDATDADAGRVHHPDACEPAAWSAGSAFGFAQATLGVDIDDGEPSVNPSSDLDAASEAMLYKHGQRYIVRKDGDSTVIAPSDATE